VTADPGFSVLSGDYLLQVVGSFFLVICVLLAVMLILKRFNTVGASSGSYIKVLESAPLGQREKAVLLQVDTVQILVGVAAGNVSVLHQFPDPVEPSDKRASLSFKDVWNFARKDQWDKQ
jgi:flagellar protein FliO/FliZ